MYYVPYAVIHLNAKKRVKAFPVLSVAYFIHIYISKKFIELDRIHINNI